jgi:hypothetical protein
MTVGVAPCWPHEIELLALHGVGEAFGVVGRQSSSCMFLTLSVTSEVSVDLKTGRYI